MDLSVFRHQVIMTKAFTTIVLLILSIYVQAQKLPSKIIRMDTINVRGKIIAIDGSNVYGIAIQSRTPHKKYNGFKETAGTDSSGNFVLNGLKPIDTLSFRYAGVDYTFINKGSRYITIKVSSGALTVPGANKPQVTAKRIHKRKEVSFSVIDNYNCNFSILANAGFPSGIKSYAERINQNLVYPPAAIKNNIEGTVTVEFSVERNGDVVRPKIINGLGYGCDEAAINAILKGPRCSPGVANGRAVALTYQIDVTFKLED